MSNKRISELTELASGQIVGTDLAPVVDVSDTTHAASGTTKKTTFAAILAYIVANISSSTPTIEWVDLTGDIDSVNTVFTLATEPDNGVIEVALARQKQFETLDYAYDGNVTITFNTAPDESLAAEPLKALVY